MGRDALALADKRKKGYPMRKTWIAALITLITLPACAPLVVAGAGAIAADTVVEETEGGDGLF